jgi:uncharacterized C2H2 Zn-finger protein
MEPDLHALRQELNAIEEHYETKFQITQFETAIASERAIVQDMEDKIWGIRRLLGLPDQDEESSSSSSSSSSTSSIDDDGVDESVEKLKVRGPKRPVNKDRPYLCPKCGLDFNAYKYLARHQNQTGHGGSPYSCPKCGEGFRSERDLQRHQTKEEHL